MSGALRTNFAQLEVHDAQLVRLGMLAERYFAEGGTQPNLNLSEIKEFSISLPCLEEQRVIIELVGAITEWTRKIETRLSTARRHVDRSAPAALALAFRGELVPQDPNDEPASELLARLRARPESLSKASKPKRGTRAA